MTDSQPKGRDLRAEVLGWIDAREKECESATLAPWSFSPQHGRPGHAFLAQVWRWNGDSLATLDATVEPTVATRDASFIASARTALPLALKALRQEATGHIPYEANQRWWCGTCGGREVPKPSGASPAGPCPAIRRLHAALLGDSNV